MPEGFGKPSNWKEWKEDLAGEMIKSKEAQRIFEEKRDSSIQNDFAGAFEAALKQIKKKNK